MSSPWISPEACPSLAVLVESVTAPLLIQHASPVCLEMDIEDSVEIPADPNRTAELIRALVSQALGELPSGGDLSITAKQTAQAVLLEFADTGSPLEARSKSIPIAAGAISASLDWQGGSECGAVIKITIPRTKQSGRQAA